MQSNIADGYSGEISKNFVVERFLLQYFLFSHYYSNSFYDPFSIRDGVHLKLNLINDMGAERGVKGVCQSNFGVNNDLSIKPYCASIDVDDCFFFLI